jgi:hypothetical protein
VFVLAPITGTSATPSFSDEYLHVAGGAAPGAQAAMESVMATCARRIRFGVQSMNGKTELDASPVSAQS